jgi:hypothetical protein
MIGIYKNDFLEYLQNALGEKPKVTGKNIIVPCPWCEYGEKKDHYHLYISLTNPIFNCFHSGCKKSGFLTKFLNKIEGSDSISFDRYVDKDKIKTTKLETSKQKKTKLIIPEIDVDQFPYKTLYLRKRFKFSSGVDIKTLPGLIFDFLQFLSLNKIQIDPENKLYKLQYYLQSNFVGFITENRSYIIFRNIDESSDFKHYKFTIDEKSKLLDYYRIQGNINGNSVVVAEGIYDIYSEYLFDFLNKKSDIYMYATALSDNYQNLIKGIVFNEQIFRLNLLVLSDNNIPLKDYEKLKYYNKHIIDNMTVYYNKTGKDFNELPVILNEFKI